MRGFQPALQQCIKSRLSIKLIDHHPDDAYPFAAIDEATRFILHAPSVYFRASMTLPLPPKFIAPAQSPTLPLPVTPVIDMKLPSSQELLDHIPELAHAVADILHSQEATHTPLFTPSPLIVKPAASVASPLPHNPLTDTDMTLERIKHIERELFALRLAQGDYKYLTHRRNIPEPFAPKSKSTDSKNTRSEASFMRSVPPYAPTRSVLPISPALYSNVMPHPRIIDPRPPNVSAPHTHHLDRSKVVSTLEHFRLATDTPHCDTADSPQCNSAVSCSIDPAFFRNDVQHRPNVWRFHAHKSDRTNVGNTAIYSAFTSAIPQCNNTDSSPCNTRTSPLICPKLHTVEPEHRRYPSNPCARELDHAANVDKSISSTFSTAVPHRLLVYHSLRILPASSPMNPALYTVAPEHCRYPSNLSARNSDHAPFVDKSDSPAPTALVPHCRHVDSSPHIMSASPPIDTAFYTVIQQHRIGPPSPRARNSDHAQFVDKSFSPVHLASTLHCPPVDSLPCIVPSSSLINAQIRTTVAEPRRYPSNIHARNSDHAAFIDKSFCPANPWHLCMPLSHCNPHRPSRCFISPSLCHHSCYVPPRLTLAGD
jgi:hypothetical protein